MANIRKFSDMKAIGHLCRHYERGVERGHYSNTDIDENRTSENYNLAPDRGKQTDYVKKKINEIMNGRTLRKDAVKMCCCVVDAPKGMAKEDREKFFKEVYKFLVYRYGRKSGLGEDIVISAYVHNDETTSHLHFAFLPVIEKNGVKTFCAKDVVGRKDLKTLHEDLGDFLESRNVCTKKDILTGKTIRDSSGRALSVRELKRRTYIREREIEKNGRWNVEKPRVIERESRW